MNCLYRAYNQNNTLLYIGITTNIKERMREHKKVQRREPETYSPWANDVDHFHMQFFHSRDYALNEEELAIKLENPAHNHQHKKGSTSNEAEAKARRKHMAWVRLWRKYDDVIYF